MAKAKAKKVPVSKVRKAAVVPQGYKTLDRAPNWDHEKHPLLEGVRGKLEEQSFRDGSDRRFFSVNDPVVGNVTVWESTMLRNLFDNTSEGDTVRIEYLGLGESKFPGDSPPKLFTCAVKEGRPARRDVSTKRNPF